MADTPRHTYQILTKRSKRLASLAGDLEWPSNVWMGVSVETSRYAFRLDHLRSVSAAVRFVSAEPLLSPLSDLDLSGLHWLIAGGESGPRARPMHAVVGTGSARPVRRYRGPLLLQAMGRPHAQSQRPRTRRHPPRCDAGGGVERACRTGRGCQMTSASRASRHPYEMRQPGMLSRPGTEFLLLS